MQAHPHISKKILQWYAQHKRPLPWRETRDAYLVWVSEVILQQTRVEQGTPYYHRFISAFPTVVALARANEDDVLRQWQGLGYYSRARNMHRAAKVILEKYHGDFPTSYQTLISLPGVGPYTAAAVASITSDEPVAAVDGNVIRVVCRLMGIAEDVQLPATKTHVAGIATELLAENPSGTFNQAMMELGALQCVPLKPDCLACPLADTCIAHRQGVVSEIPYKPKKARRRSRFLHYLVISDGAMTLIEKRGNSDIWAGLYQFPMLETEDGGSIDPDTLSAYFSGMRTEVRSVHKAARHILSHQDIMAKFYRIHVQDVRSVNLRLSGNFQAVRWSELHTFAVPRLIDKYLEGNPE